MKQKYNKRIFTIKEHIKIINRAARSFHILRYVKRNRLFDKKFKERIMLAVTEVNGCELCSYVHTKVSLSSGMSSNEIKQILLGSKDDIPESELVGVLFGEHYAYSHEKPDQVAINRLIQEYGEEKAKIICAILSMITMTNSMGIAMASFKERLMFKAVKKSKISSEILIPISTLMLFPLLYVIHFLKNLRGASTCSLVSNH
jgi:AhpD family alkylhydroperoxidase